MAPREFVDIFIRRIPPYDQPTLNSMFAEEYPVFMDRVQKALRGLRVRRNSLFWTAVLEKWPDQYILDFVSIHTPPRVKAAFSQETPPTIKDIESIGWEETRRMGVYMKLILPKLSDSDSEEDNQDPIDADGDQDKRVSSSLETDIDAMCERLAGVELSSTLELDICDNWEMLLSEEYEMVFEDQEEPTEESDTKTDDDTPRNIKEPVPEDQKPLAYVRGATRRHGGLGYRKWEHSRALEWNQLRCLLVFYVQYGLRLTIARFTDSHREALGADAKVVFAVLLVVQRMPRSKTEFIRYRLSIFIAEAIFSSLLSAYRQSYSVTMEYTLIFKPTDCEWTGLLEICSLNQPPHLRFDGEVTSRKERLKALKEDVKPRDTVINDSANDPAQRDARRTEVETIAQKETDVSDKNWWESEPENETLEGREERYKRAEYQLSRELKTPRYLRVLETHRHWYRKTARNRSESERREFLDHVKKLRNSDEFKAAKKAYQEQKRAEARARRAKGEPSERDYNRLLESRAYDRKRKFNDLYGVTRPENELQHTHALREAWGEWAVALVQRCLHSLKLNIPISTNNYVPTLSMLQYATGVLKEAGKLDEETESRVEKLRRRVHQRYAHNQYAHNADPAWAEKFIVDKPEGMDVEYPYQPWPDLSPPEGLSVTEQKNWITHQRYLAKHAMLNYQKKDEWTHRQVSTRQKYELVLVAKWLYFFHKGWVLGKCTKPTTTMVDLARRVLAQEGRLDKKMEAGLEWILKEISSEKKRSFKEEVKYWAPRTSTAKKQLDDARQLGDNELIQRRWGKYAVSLVNKYLAYYSSNKKPEIREKPTTEMVDHARAVLIAEGKHDEVVEGHLKHLEAEVLQRPSTQA